MKVPMLKISSVVGLIVALLFLLLASQTISDVLLEVVVVLLFVRPQTREDAIHFWQAIAAVVDDTRWLSAEQEEDQRVTAFKAWSQEHQEDEAVFLTHKEYETLLASKQQNREGYETISSSELRDLRQARADLLQLLPHAIDTFKGFSPIMAIANRWNQKRD